MDLRYKKYVGKTTFFFAIFLHKIIPFTADVFIYFEDNRKYTNISTPSFSLKNILLNTL